MAQVKNLDKGIGWKTLAKTLRNIQIGINRNDPIKGHGILIHRTDTGTIISIAPKTSDDTGNDANNVNNGVWKNVTIVDPVTCAQSTLTVWTLPGGGK